MTFVLIVLTFCIFLLTVLVLNQLMFWLSRKQRRLTERLKVISVQPIKHSVPQDFKIHTKKFGRWIKTASLLGPIVGRKYLAMIQTKLVKAGVPMKAEEMIALNVIFGLGVTGIGVTIFPNLISGIIFGLLSFSAPIMWVNHLQHQRTKKVENQLLDAILLLANSLRAGHSFLQALDLVARESPPLLSTEFNQVIRETKVGMSMEESLTNLTKRLESKELELVVTGVLIQRQVGGNLAEVLDTVAETISKRIKTRAKIRTLTAQGRLSAWILSLLPFGLAAMIFTFNPNYSRIMLKEPLGVAMLLGGGIMMVLGILVLRKVVSIDV